MYKNSINLALIFLVGLFISACSSKQFAFRSTVSVKKQPTISTTFSEPELVCQSAQVKAAPTHPVAVSPHSVHNTLKLIVPVQDKRVYSLAPSGSFKTEPSDTHQVAKTAPASPHNTKVIATLGLLSGVFGLFAFGIVLGLLAILLGLVALSMAEKSGERKLLSLLALFLGVFDVFMVLVYLTALV